MGRTKAPDFVGLDADGFEHPDPRPVELPTRLRMPQRQVDRVRSIIRQELSDEARVRGVETFQESDDFEMDDVEPFSPYEEVFEPNPELTKRRKSDKMGRRRNDAALNKEQVHAERGSESERSRGVGGRGTHAAEESRASSSRGEVAGDRGRVRGDSSGARRGDGEVEPRGGER